MFGGLFGYNLLRICCISVFAKCVVNSEPRKSVCAALFDCLCVPREAKKIVRLIYAIDEARQRMKTNLKAVRGHSNSFKPKSRHSVVEEEEEDEDVRHIEKRQRSP